MLNLLIIIPFLGAGLIWLFPHSSPPQRFRNTAFALAVVLLVWTVVLAVQFDPSQADLQFVQRFAWIKPIGFDYSLGMDGLSLPLVFLNNLLMVIAIAASSLNLERPRFYYSLLFLLNAGVSGAFLAQDYLLFFLFYELELIPLYLLIAIWGGSRRGYASTKFLLYTAVSGILVLASFLGIVWFSGASSFAYQPALAQALPLGTQMILLIGLLIGFGIKIPIFPFHTWLPDAHVEASTPISVLLAGVLLKLGTYGLLRFGVGMMADAWHVAAPWLAVWAAVSALFGSLTAIAQQDMKKVVAYSSIAHMAYVLLAAAAATPLSLLGAMCQMIGHGLISALLFLLVGVVGKKTGTRDVYALRGLLNPERGLPIVGSLMVMAAMASAGIPGMAGFVAEFLVFRGSFPVFAVPTLLCMIGTGLTAVYFLLIVNRVFFGRLSPLVTDLPQVQWGDRLPAIVLLVLTIALGIQPAWMVRWSETATASLQISRSPSASYANVLTSEIQPPPDAPPSTPLVPPKSHAKCQ